MRTRNVMAAALLLALSSVLSCGGPSALSASSSRLVSAQLISDKSGFSVMQQLLAFHAPPCTTNAECNPASNSNLANYPAPNCSEYANTCSRLDGTPGWCVLRLTTGSECLAGTTWNCKTSGNNGIYACDNTCMWSTAGCRQCGGVNQACCPLASGLTCTAFRSHCDATNPAFPTGVCIR